MATTSCSSLLQAASLRPTQVRPHGYRMATHAGEDVVSSALQQTGRWETESIETLGVDNATDARAGGSFLPTGTHTQARS